MIARLRGIVDSAGADRCVIDVGGVGYLVFCSSRTLTALPATGAEAMVHIETHVREDHIHLYGFSDVSERDCFNMLLGVQSVGARVALAILSALAPGDLVRAILAQDKTMLTQAPGVGPKLAQRIVTELKDRVGDLALGPGAALVATPAASAADALAGDAVSALVNLGYRQLDAFAAVQTAAWRLDGEPDLQTLIRGGLQELSP